MLDNRREYREGRPTDYLDNIGKISNTAERLVRVLKLCSSETEISQLQGPTLALYAGTAEAEREFISLLSVRNKKIVAVDYNPDIKSKEKHTSYKVGEVVEVLSKLSNSSFGIITIFHADGSMSEKDWKEVQKEAGRVLSPGGHIIIYPNVFIRQIPNGFNSVIDDSTWSVIFLKKAK